ncbi:MAG: DNA alkylation repair protein [Tannerella sp.]|jgi:3-methyladenine DNA glycosylase AlkD|nr:DNA alkylation repair protein [Tannerella sp.]
MNHSTTIISKLQSAGTPEKAAHLMRFFKTGKGQYGEGDLFLGVTVPLSRSIAKAHINSSLDELQPLLNNPYHEVRLCALVIMTLKHKKASEEERTKLFDFYLKNTQHINNWDLVDLSCPIIVGDYLLKKDRNILYTLADSKNLWEQRIAIISTMTFIRHDDYDDTQKIALKLINHPHDLIHKAIGWMLREIGKRSRETLTSFLTCYATQLPRTALRYAIEHYPEPERKNWLLQK